MPAPMHRFPYDRFQQEAIDAIREGISVFVSAPTGSGKTVIAEVAVEEALKRGGMAIYTSPIKALSNQKYRDFYARYGDKVGILTGDLTLNADADLLVMTTEIYRNTLFEGSTRFSRCRWVIFDEVHYLDDPERGTVWEEALLLTPRETEILALSATIPNAKQLASWIEKIHGRPVRVVLEDHRVIPLRFYFQCQNEVYTNTEAMRAHGYAGMEEPRGGQRPFRMARHRGGKHYFRHRPGGSGPPREHHGRANRADHLVRRVVDAGNTPCIYFASAASGSRSWRGSSAR
jgi:superfamily II RNA helicase